MYAQLLVAGVRATLNPPPKKMAKKQVEAWCTETDGQTLRSFVLRDNHLILCLALLLVAIGLRQYPIKAELRAMHPIRTRI